MKKPKCTVVGLGYVGLALALDIAESGFEVFGFDIDATRLQDIKSCKNLDLGESDISRLNNFLQDGSIRLTSNSSVISESEIIVVCVPTPLKDSNTPDLEALKKAFKEISIWISTNTLICQESTTYPGNTRELFNDIILGRSENKLKKIYLSFSSERVDPGNLNWGIRNTPKVVSGINEESLHMASNFYSKFSKVEQASSLEVAEFSKLIENSFRLVNISFVNEMLILGNSTGIDTWEAIELASTKPFGFMKFSPGAGAGGHCIPVDPVYLSWFANRERKKVVHDESFDTFTPLLDSSILTNAKVIKFICNKVDKLIKRKSNILIYGLGYKENVLDIRESPAVKVFKELKVLGHEVYWMDPKIRDTHLPNCVENINYSEVQFDGILLFHKVDETSDNRLISKFKEISPLVVDVNNRNPGFELFKL